MLKKLKIMIRKRMPVTKEEYAGTILKLIKIIEAQKEAQMFMRNDIFQMSEALQNMGQESPMEEKEKTNDFSNFMFG